MDPITRMQWIDLRVAHGLCAVMGEKIAKCAQGFATLPEKKQRGVFLTAWYCVHGLRDDLMESFDNSQPSFAYWCWYAVLCEDLRALLLQHPKAGEWTR